MASFNWPQGGGIPSEALTAWTAYTPTITGFGTPTNINFRSRRVGSNLEILGSFTSGTSTSVEARITIGFNGVNGNVTSASWFSSTQPVGYGALSVTSAVSAYILIEASSDYFTFGFQGVANAGLQKVNGSNIAASGTTFRFSASIPINGWE
jgi:hypothetical protein